MRAWIAGVVLLGAALAGCGSPSVEYGEQLADYAAEKARIVKLPGGERLAIGSRTGHDITVQWGDGDSWTAPEEVYTERLWTHDINVEHAGGTVAISPDFWAEKELDDDYAPDHTALVVCHDHACAEPVVSEHLSSAQLDGEGSLVAFGTGTGALSLWERGEGTRQLKLEGLPAGSEVRLAPAGRFLGLAARNADGSCFFDLYESERGRARFTKVATTPGYPEPQCRPLSLDLDGDDRAQTHVDSAGGNVPFVRDGDGWRVDLPDVPRMVIRDTQGRSTIPPAELHVRDSTEVVLGSRDGHSIVMQYRHQGAGWSREKEIARAPDGTVCRHASSREATGAAMVQLACYPPGGDADPGERVPVALVLATTNGESWRSLTLPDAAFDPVGDLRGMLAVGARRSLYFAPGFDDFVEVRLPVDEVWDGLALTPDGKGLVRLIGNPDPSGRCPYSWTTAPLTATTWQAPRPLDIEPYDDGPGTCEAGIFWIGDYYEASWGNRWEGGLELRDGELVVSPPLD